MLLGSDNTNLPSLPWERSSSAPCGEYNNDDGLRTPWQQHCDVNNVKNLDVKVNSPYNRSSLRNEEIKEEIIDDDNDEGSISYNKQPITEASNKNSSITSKDYNVSSTNESMSESNTRTEFDSLRTNGRKLKSPSQRASMDTFRSTPHESKLKVSLFRPSFRNKIMLH